ncbi:hypothetical protein H4W81_008776 [Nonomuraea africana]|uniref:Uncharacterized protein n=1 Tax=Nonomuraea africana TaxID=46171 RepID=A0ABR9KVE2_9ACTN|nr:hypothetical protein [Nonomuraea africana]MBE1565997.1 hypothetical protein [Nonomuraea africana]
MAAGSALGAVEPVVGGPHAHRIPSMSCRFVHFGGLPGFFPAGSNGSSTAH